MRVFINDVDSYVGRAIAEAFLKVYVGWSTAEDDGDEERDADEPLTPPKEKYEVFGTVSAGGVAPAGTTVVDQDRAAIAAVLPRCAHVVYQLFDSEQQAEDAAWAVQLLQDGQDKLLDPVAFVCVSNCMSWAKTKSSDPDDPELPITEEDYRRRKGHPNFKAHAATEKLVMKAGKEVAEAGGKLSTHVVAAGVPYGAGEGPFHWLFKTAWLLVEPGLPMIGDGLNVVPTIHVRDLAFAVVNVAQRRPERRYILAVDDGGSTLAEIVEAVSGALGPGPVCSVTKAEGLLLPALTQSDFDTLTLNLRFEPGTVKDLRIEWEAAGGVVSSLDAVVADYRKTRGLLPLKVCVLGPPAVGKSYIARHLCRIYKLQYLHTRGVVDAHVAGLEASVSLLTADGDVDDELKAQAESDQATLSALTAERDAHHGKVTDDTLRTLFRAAISARASANHGFLLDGYPKTIEQAAQLFAGEDEGPDLALLPEFVFALQAPEPFLRDRIMQLPESEVVNTHNTEDGFSRRTAAYHERNSEETTVLNYFDELEVHPVVLDVATVTTDALTTTLEHTLGKPRHYGPTVDECAALERDMLARAERQAVAAATVKATEDAAADAHTSAAQAAWAAQWAEVKRQEEEMLDTAALPLRHFLMKHVMPTLTQGLLDVCKTRPADPIDFLAAYLLQHNPQIE